MTWGKDYVTNRAQGADRRSAGAENQDFQLRTRRWGVPASAMPHISATQHFFANFRENQYIANFSTITHTLQPFNTCINTLNTDAFN